MTRLYLHGGGRIDDVAEFPEEVVKKAEAAQQAGKLWLELTIKRPTSAISGQKFESEVCFIRVESIVAVSGSAP